MLPRLWNEVIIKIYLQKKTMEDWLRKEKKNWVGSSYLWRALTSSLPVITTWLVWKPRNGKEVCLGEDPMVGYYIFNKLSSNPIMTLKAQGLHFSTQAEVINVEETNHTSWKKVENLGLEGEIKQEWTNYRKGLIGAGI